MRWQVVVPKGIRRMVLQAVHGASGTGHFGVAKTVCHLYQVFYWSQHRRDVKDYCWHCDNCTACKGPKDTSNAQLQQFLVGCPMERVGIDVLGLFPCMERGYRYVLTAMDYFTKWPEAYSLLNQEAETIVDAMVVRMFSRYGTPEVIHTNQGRNFESHVFTAMCEILGSCKTHTTPLHPQSNVLVKKFNRTLAEQLAMITAKHQQDLDAHVPPGCSWHIGLLLRTLLMMGWEIRTLAEMMVGRPPHCSLSPRS
ncbi:hypothetical protein LDENG_00121840 [Lucifuga dentata]|nr:hypothetical protein LDENG_00121840 [Lucifuga dentata]